MADGHGDLLTIGALSQASGATPRAIRFYEGLGLVSASQRSSGGYRLFRPEELDRLNLVTGLRKSGFSIKEIVRLFGIASGSRTAAAAARSIKETLGDDVADVVELAEEMRLLAADLNRTADVLTRCLGCDKGFDELNCGECEPIKEIGVDRLPTAMRALWPLNGR
jgi:DNA-binding transcriptional MerR regulator